MAKRLFRSAPKFWGTNEEAIRKTVLQMVGDLQRGKTNNTYLVTLGASVTTTTLQTEIGTADSEVFFTPRTASAATTVGAGNIRATCADGGLVTFTHDSNVATDRTFGVVLVG